jgi:hypothetical protein
MSIADPVGELNVRVDVVAATGERNDVIERRAVVVFGRKRWIYGRAADTTYPSISIENPLTIEEVSGATKTLCTTPIAVCLSVISKTAFR